MGSKIDKEIQDICNKLKANLTLLLKRSKSDFKLGTVNNGKIDLWRIRTEKNRLIDQADMDSNVETLWSIQDKSVRFIICEGELNLYFRLNENVYKRKLVIDKTLKIPPGISFMLKTDSKKCSLLLMLSQENKNEIG